MPDTGILKFNTGTFKLVNAQQSKHRSKGVLGLGIDASEEASERGVMLRNEQLMTRVLETPEQQYPALSRLKSALSIF